MNRLVPGDVKYLALLAKQWSDLTFYHDVATDQERQLVNLKALEYANKVGRRGGGLLQSFCLQVGEVLQFYSGAEAESHTTLACCGNVLPCLDTCVVLLAASLAVLPSLCKRRLKSTRCRGPF